MLYWIPPPLGSRPQSDKKITKFDTYVDSQYEYGEEISILKIKAFFNYASIW